MEATALFYFLCLVIAFGCFVFVLITREKNTIEELAMANHEVFYRLVGAFVVGVVLVVMVLFDGAKTILFP